MEGIRAASVYAEADFRINQSAYRNIDKFEKKIDKLKKKLDGLSSPNISVGGRVSSGALGGTGGGRVGGGGGRQGEGWYWNTIGKVAYNMRKREAMVDSALVGMKNTYRTLKLPQKEMDRLSGSVKEYGEKLKSGTMISAEFAVQIKKIKSEARDLHKTLNVPPPKYSTGINKGLGLAMTPMIKAKYKQEGKIEAAESRLHRTLNELKIDLTSARGKEALAKFQGISDVFRDAPHDVNAFRKSITALDLDLRKAGRGGLAGFSDKLRSVRGNLIALGGAAAVAASAGLVGLGQQLMRTKLMMSTAFGENAAKEIRFVRKEADELGLSFNDAARAWAKIGLTTEIGGYTMQSARKMFSSIMDMSLAMGLSAEQLSLSFMAVSQAYTKGALTSEDLKGQLAEHIPGIVPMIQKELGYAGQGDAFDKALRNKEIKPDQFADAIARAFVKYTQNIRTRPETELLRKFGEARNAFGDLAEAFTIGAGPGLVLALDNLVFIMKNSLPVWKALGAAIGGLAGAVTLIPRMMAAVIHDMYYYIMGDKNVRKELHEFFGGKAASVASLSKSTISSLMSHIPGTGPAAIAASMGETIGKYITDALKGSMKIEILPSPDFTARTSSNNPWPAFNTAAP